MKYSTPRRCPVPGCTHAPIQNAGGYTNHVASCRRKYIEREAARKAAARYKCLEVLFSGRISEDTDAD